MILAIIAIGRQILMITMICTIYAYMCMSMAEWMCARRPSNGHFSWEFVPSCGGKQALTKSSWQNSGILWWSLSGSGHFALQAVLHPDAGSLKHPQPIGQLADRDRFRQASLCESLVFRHVFIRLWSREFTEAKRFPGGVRFDTSTAKDRFQRAYQTPWRLLKKYLAGFCGKPSKRVRPMSINVPQPRPHRFHHGFHGSLICKATRDTTRRTPFHFSYFVLFVRTSTDIGSPMSMTLIGKCLEPKLTLDHQGEHMKPQNLIQDSSLSSHVDPIWSQKLFWSECLMTCTPRSRPTLPAASAEYSWLE